MIVTVISLIGFVATLVLALYTKKHMQAGDVQQSGSTEANTLRNKRGFILGVLLCVTQLAMVVLGIFGLAPYDILSPIFLNVVLIACTYASLHRNGVRSWLDRTVQPVAQQKANARSYVPSCGDCEKYDECSIRIKRAEDMTIVDRMCLYVRKGALCIVRALRCPAGARIVTFMLAGLFAMLALEIPSNHDLFWAHPACIFLEWALITAVMAGTYYLFQQRIAVPSVIAFACWGVGMAQYFVITFKSMPITPADLSALGTAAAVGQGYTYMFSPFGLYALGFLAISLFLCSIAGELRVEHLVTKRKNIIINIVAAIVLLGGVAAHTTLIDYYHTLNITLYTWRPLESYYRQGFLPTFISSAQTIKPPVPAGYSVDKAKSLIDQTAETYDSSVLSNDESYAKAKEQFSSEKPTVITVMNETFSDLSIYQNMHANYQGPQYFKSLSNALSRGKLYVSAYGGGTCNTEFEYLTGNSMAYLGAGVYPYTIYNLNDTDNLAAQFKNLGYDTTAMHPNHGTNWNRENVYQSMGFDQFLTIKDFDGSERLRGMVSDAATYDKTLELLENNPNPQFIFNVTMQNHSGYNTNLIPADKLEQYLIDGVSNPEINEYLSLIEESDKALEEFLNKLRKLDRKVVVVFFGDHQPFFPSEYNDRWFTNEDPATHAERLWQTNYVIWANYDVAGNSQTSEENDLSTNYLGSELMRLIGAPLSNYQKAQLSLRDAMPAINSTGYQDADGTWHLSNTKEEELTGPSALAAAAARKDLATMQFYQLFGDGKDVYTKQKQSAANETDPNLAPGTTKIK